ncbi:PP2C family protein-serine/threonine phosphatase [Rothia santali]|uniref:PP2C family protein-serine/threonine phosphatase n=1 Tax=Rothia santali TaxID=2949643 RepID=UPI0028155001|nr:protein phosphatase 2C domain-containing protein [Rothia santali]
MTESVELATCLGATTHRGCHRKNNEDSLVTSGNLSVVADGMGGHEAGEVASSIAVNTLSASPLFATRSFAVEDSTEEPEEQRGLFRRRRRATSRLNERIMGVLREIKDVIGEADENIKTAGNMRAGTTLTGAWLTRIGEQNMWIIFNVGDSRTYRLRREEDAPITENSTSMSQSAPQGVELEQVTVDHSEVQYLVDTGQITALEALTHPRRNVITRALGTGNYWEPDFWVIPAHPGDRLMMCSDGLSGELSNEYMARVLATVAHPKDAADVLQAAAIRAGGRDNISVIVVDAVPEGSCRNHGCDGDTDGVHEQAAEEGVIDLDTWNAKDLSDPSRGGSRPDGPLAPEETTVDADGRSPQAAPGEAQDAPGEPRATPGEPPAGAREEPRDGSQ